MSSTVFLDEKKLSTSAAKLDEPQEDGVSSIETITALVAEGEA